MIKIHKSKKSGFYVTYSAKNGEIVCHSEIVKSKASAKKNIKAMVKIIDKNIFPASVWGATTSVIQVLDCTGDKPVKIWI